MLLPPRHAVRAEVSRLGRHAFSQGSLKPRRALAPTHQLNLWQTWSLGPCYAGSGSIPPLVGREVASEVWQRLSLVRRQQEVAVAEEDYALAAKLRDESKALAEALSPMQQFLHSQATLLRKGTHQEKLAAIQAMADAGDPIVVPELAACLSDPQLQQEAQGAMWALFTTNSDPEINELMVQGTRFMQNPEAYEKALEVFEAMVQRAPSFPEAYNKRATVLYQMRRFKESIEDCRAVLRMQPYHFGAASGMGLCYLVMNQEQEALEAFELSLKINPGLKEIAKVVNALKERAAKRAVQQAVEAKADEPGSSTK